MALPRIQQSYVAKYCEKWISSYYLSTIVGQKVDCNTDTGATGPKGPEVVNIKTLQSCPILRSIAMMLAGTAWHSHYLLKVVRTLVHVRDERIQRKL